MANSNGCGDSALRYVPGLRFLGYVSERGQSSRLLRSVLAVHRFVLLVLVVWMLTGWNIQRIRVDPPELVIAVDVSDSMQTSDSLPSGETLGKNSSTNSLPRLRLTTRDCRRAAKLLNLTQSQLSDLHQRYRLRLYVMADELQSVLDEDSGERSTDTF